MNQSIRLVIVIKNIDGGTGTFLFNFLKIKKLFLKDSLYIKVLVLEKPKYRIVNPKDFIFFEGKTATPQKYTVNMRNIKSFFKQITWLTYHINKRKPDSIIGIDVHANILVMLARYFSNWKTKTILTTHIDLKRTLQAKSTFFLSLLLQFVISHLYNRADEIICISKELSLNFKNDFRIKKTIHTIYYGGSFPTPRKRKKEKIIVSVARLDRQKDHYTLLKAFKRVKRQVPSVKLWLIGDGPLKGQLKHFIRKIGLGNSVRFLGWQKNVNPILQKASVFVLSTKREGFSYALLEALSQGIPVIATDAPYGPREILDNNKNGFLVKPYDEVELAKRITEILTDKKTYTHLSQKGIERSTFFSLGKMLQSYKKILIGLVNQ